MQMTVDDENDSKRREKKDKTVQYLKKRSEEKNKMSRWQKRSEKEENKNLKQLPSQLRVAITVSDE